MTHYRYVLTREFAGMLDAEPRCLNWMMLNPSTADEREDDPTIRRVMDFTRRAGFTNLKVYNLIPRRATDPEELKKYEKSRDFTALFGTPRSHFRAEKDMQQKHLSDLISPHPIVLAWGMTVESLPWAFSQAVLYLEFLVESLATAANFRCLGTTRQGHPRHPLYLSKNTQLESFDVAGYIQKWAGNGEVVT